MPPHVVLRVVAKLLIPMIVVYGFFVHFHGEYSPGGGFQAGVVLGSAIILYALIYGMEAARRAVPPWWTRVGMALGSMIFAGVGFVTIILGGNSTAQHIGIIAVEIGVLMTVTSVIIAIFYAFGGRSPDLSDEEW